MFELHHVGYLVRDIPTAAKEFVDRFGYQVESPVVEDALQTARVQFLRQPGAAHWLELIAPANSNSKLSMALEQGGGLHHLCYEVPDIAEASGKLRASGMLPLGEARPATAFSGRLIAWYMDRGKLLVELVESGPGELSLATIQHADAK